MSNFPPKVFIIGSQKSATTSLASLLNQNPDVCLSEPKEPNYYSVNYQLGEQWYKERFSDLNKVLIDASTTYSMHPLTHKSLSYKRGREALIGVSERIYKDSSDAKLIYILRDPVLRIYSNYWHNVKYGYENKTYEQAIADDSLYIETSMYFQQIKQYLKYFNKENILVIKFEDFVKNQLSYLNLCERFIGIHESANITKNHDENKGKQYGKIGRILIRNPFVNLIDRVSPKFLRTTIQKVFAREIPRLSETKYNELKPIFLEDQKHFHEIFDTGYFDDN